MMYASLLTIEHYFAANFPTSVWEGSICDVNAFFNCDASAFSSIAQFGGVPMGYFGFMAGALVQEHEGDAGFLENWVGG